MASTKTRAELTTGQLGTATGLSADSIRHYEKLGLLKKPVRSDGGYRLYDPDAITSVQTIRSAVKAGFTLAELSGIFRERDAGGAPCHRVAALATNKVQSLELQIRELTRLRDWLASTADAWQKRLERTPAGKCAGLLESLGRQLSAAAQQVPKGPTDEGARPRLSSLPGRSTGSHNHGMYRTGTRSKRQ